MSSAKDSGPGLRRDVGLTLFALYGIGNIIGAGIYVLVGKVAGEAGYLAPLAFVLAAIIAGLTGLSYGELAARYPVSAGEAVYLHKAFRRRWLSMAVGFLIAVAGLVSAATMAHGFVGYFNQFSEFNATLTIIILISTLMLIAVRGIAESARAAALLTLVEAGGLVWIISVASPNIVQLADIPPVAFFTADGAAWQGFFAATFLAFFAFIGFEDMVSIAEEVRDPERNMPRGILWAFAISTSLYLLVTLVSIATLPIGELARSEAPLADVYQVATQRPAVIIGLIGLVAVINGALIQIIKAARVFYGMSCNGWLPPFFGVVNARTHTPLRATLVAGGIVLILALLLPLVSLAKLTSGMVLLVFALVNLALIRVKHLGPPPAGVRAVPLWVPKLAALASIGILLTVVVPVISLDSLLSQASAATPAPDSNTSPPVLLLENVRLLDEDSTDDYPTVNLLIVDGKLKAVSEDPIPVEESTLVIDTKGGYLVGQIELDAPPSFMILTGDPRTDFDQLLDTKKNATFAIAKGDIVRNRYIGTTETPATRERKPAGWLAYTPPPLSMPGQYRDTTKWNRWESKYVDGLFVAALALDRTRWVSQDSASERQVGDLSDFSGGEIRGFRLGAVGTLNFDNPWVYTVFAATNAFDSGFDQDRSDDFTWFDVRLDIPFYKGTTLSIGKQKEPISMERLTSLLFLPMQERAAAFDAMLPARNTGVMLSGNMIGQRMSWAGGVFNNWLDADESFSDTATQFIGRLTGVPFESADTSNLLHLGLGGRYTNAKNGVRYFSEPEFNQAPDYVDTDFIDADDAYTWDLEAAWRKGPFMLAGEFLRTDVDAPAAGDPSFSGYYLAGTWALTGEMRSYNYKGGVFNRPPIARSVYQDGWGAWELVARYSYSDMTDGPIDGGKMDIWSLGVKWWLTPFFVVDMNYRYIDLDRFGETGASSGLNGRIVLSLE